MTDLFWNADDADFGRWSRILILLLLTADCLAPIVVEILLFFPLKNKRLQRKAGLAPKNYSNLILYFLMLTIINKKVIPRIISVSFQMTANVAPFSIIALMMMMNHFAGIILLITCNGNGMLEMGKMNPDNKITGNMSPNRESIMAVCCESEMVEIKMPSAKAQIMNKTVSKASKTKLPSMGILNIK